MEHLRAFGLSRDPFANDPLPQFHFASSEHAAAERRLVRCAAQGKGLCLLLGEPGSGKSLLARRVLDQLEDEAFEASLLVIVHGGVDEGWLLSRVARQLGVEEPGEDPIALLGQVYDQLAAFREEGRRPVLIIDDAHVLARPELMGALRALVNLEYEDQQLLTLILVGSPALEAVMALDSGLPHRVDVKVRLGAFGPEASADYLGHRIRAAGGEPAILEPAAVAAIHRAGQGLPRAMNTLADNALFEAHLAGRRRVAAGDVERAARDLGFGASGPAGAAAPAPRPAAPPAGQRRAPEFENTIPAFPMDGIGERGGAGPEAEPDLAADLDANEETPLSAVEEPEPEPEPEEALLLEADPVGDGEAAMEFVEEAAVEEERELEQLFESILESK